MSNAPTLAILKLIGLADDKSVSHVTIDLAPGEYPKILVLRHLEEAGELTQTDDQFSLVPASLVNESDGG